MRTRDELKQDAIIEATIKLVNEIGFVASSVAKIAREAGVSPATIYIYYENKEDLLVSTYVNIKQKIGRALLSDFDDTLPIRDICKKFWDKGFEYMRQRLAYIKFTEQFANSPYADLINKKEVEKYFEPMFQVVRKGIEQKIIKDVHLDIINAFFFSPIMRLSNPWIKSDLVIDESDISIAFDMAWDAIRR